MADATIRSGNLFADLPDAATDEDVTTLLDAGGARLLRIVSAGQATPAGEWYDQDDNEWVVVLAGCAGLLVEGEDAPRVLEAGDWVDLPAHRRHRVEWTDEDVSTVWLALHYP